MVLGLLNLQPMTLGGRFGHHRVLEVLGGVTGTAERYWGGKNVRDVPEAQGLESKVDSKLGELGFLIHLNPS